MADDKATWRDVAMYIRAHKLRRRFRVDSGLGFNGRVRCGLTTFEGRQRVLSTTPRKSMLILMDYVDNATK